MAHWLSSLAALPEVMSSVPSTQVWGLTNTYDNSLPAPRPSAGTHLSLLPDGRYHMTSCLTLLLCAFPAMINCILKPEPRQSPPFLSCFCQVFRITSRDLTHTTITEDTKVPARVPHYAALTLTQMLTWESQAH